MSSVSNTHLFELHREQKQHEAHAFVCFKVARHKAAIVHLWLFVLNSQNQSMMPCQTAWPFMVARRMEIAPPNNCLEYLRSLSKIGSEINAGKPGGSSPLKLSITRLFAVKAHSVLPLIEKMTDVLSLGTELQVLRDVITI